MLRRRLLLALTTAALLLPVAAVPVAKANIGECLDATVNHYFNGNSWLEFSSRHVNEVRGDIDVGGHFWPCSSSPPTIFKHDMANMHIDIVPASGNPRYHIDGIVAVGIVSCNDAYHAVCTGQGSRRIYGEVSGCSLHNEFDFGSGPGTNVNYRIAVWSTTITFHYNTGSGWVLAKTVPKSDPALSCWINSYTKVDYTGETWDQGDSLGDTDNPTWLTAARYSTTENPGLTTPSFLNIYGLDCEHNDSGVAIHHHCLNQGPDSFKVYSS